MIAAWMLYTMAVGFLLYAAAMGAEYVTRALRVPARFVWLFAMMTTIVSQGARCRAASVPRGRRRSSEEWTVNSTRNPWFYRRIFNER